MAEARGSRKDGGNSGNGSPRKKRNHTKTKSAAMPQAGIGVEQVKHLLRAPSGYADIARQFAHGLEQTNFRGDISPRKIRALLARGERLTQRAAVAQVKATAADRTRMVHDSQMWKTIMSTWRMVVAAMPDHPELEEPFAFMQAYMSVTRSAPPAQTPAAPPSAT
ncbi:MAG: hypothetical protein ACHQ9S_23225 [Candidatus Binatia bacterium]